MKTILRDIILIAFGPILLFAFGFFAINSPQVPYNMRELFTESNLLLTLMLLILLLYWSTGSSVVWARWLLSGSWRKSLMLPALLIIQGLVAYGLLRASVPMESIHDIVGSPVLKWPWEWELIGRFVALYTGPSLLLAGGALTAVLMHINGINLFPTKGLLKWAATAVIVLPIFHWIVVSRAATDNLTELMAEGGTIFSSLLLAVHFFIVSFTASLVASSAAHRKHFGISLAALLLFIPLSFFILQFGTEISIHKYGNEFSALQFLLSPDRTQYLGMSQLMLRYCLVHILTVAGIAIGQFPVLIYFIMLKKKNYGHS